MSDVAIGESATGRTAWFHCFAGTAGDMTLASLVHAGADPMAVAAIVAGLAIDDYALSFEPAMRCGLSATKAVVATFDHHDHGHDHGHDTTDMTTTMRTTGRMRRSGQLSRTPTCRRASRTGRSACFGRWRRSRG